MSKLLVNVPYLEISDVSQDGTLKPHVGNGKPVVLLLQGNFCGYCTKAKPDFQKFASQVQRVTAATLQSDGGPNDSAAAQVLSSVVRNSGVPAYAGFDSRGKFVKMETGARSLDWLQDFANSLN